MFIFVKTHSERINQELPNRRRGQKVWRKKQRKQRLKQYFSKFIFLLVLNYDNIFHIEFF